MKIYAQNDSTKVSYRNVKRLADKGDIVIECAGKTDHEIFNFLSSNISSAKSLLSKTIHLPAKEFREKTQKINNAQ